MSLIRRSALPALAFVAAAAGAFAQPYGIDTREPNTSILINTLPQPPGSFTIGRTFPNINYPASRRMCHLTHAGDGSGRLFIVAQEGYIYSFDGTNVNTSTLNTFLNIQSLVRSTGDEQGLLSVAFHPNYESNGRLFVYYTRASDGATVVAEYTNDNPADNSVETASARIILTQSQDFSNHNGGQLQFGKDGYLYIGLGDGGSANDPNDRAQNMNTLLGKMLRIDVDSTPDVGLQYKIPTDNPMRFPDQSGTIVIESRRPDGTVSTPQDGYEELTGGFTDSPNKSTAAGLSGQGSRVSSNAQIFSSVRFTPNIPADGLYNVFITTPSVADANAANSNYYIVNMRDDMSFARLQLTQSNTGNTWKLVRRNVPLKAGTSNTFDISEGSPQTGNFYVDGMRFERVPAIRDEIYAYGLRNPWRFAPDRLTGTMWIGDVGQGTWEEIDILEPGGNYGWREGEGNVCTSGVSGNSNCDLSGLEAPVAVYSHSEAGFSCSVTGGYVYRGTRLPELYGRYLYADYCSGRVWSVTYDGFNVSAPTVLVSSASRDITSWGENEAGELFIVDRSAGIYQLNRTGSPTESDLPIRLSDLPPLMTLATGGQVTGIIPYAPLEPFWSDGARKTRFIALPGTTQMTYQASNGWDFPNGTTLIKHFDFPLVDGDGSSEIRLETRLMVKNNNEWFGYSYKWLEDESDALLLTSADTRQLTVQTAGGPLNFTWEFPSQNQCNQCHSVIANHALGLNTLQMNCEFLYPTSGVTDNQLRTYDHISLFANPGLPGTPDTLPSMPKYDDGSASLTARAKSYFHTNCVMCHQPGGTAPTIIDFRYETDVDDMNLLGQNPLAGGTFPEGAKLVVPGDPDLSIVYLRMNTLNDDIRMPPLGSHRVDEEGVELVRAWILSLGPAASGNSWYLY